jgi:hypothetical protein
MGKLSRTVITKSTLNGKQILLVAAHYREGIYAK